MLHLFNGDFVVGSLQPDQQPDRLRWQSPAFAAPLEFPLDCVKSIQFHVGADPGPPRGDYLFELAGGDMLIGTLSSLNDEEAEVDVPGIGKLRLCCSHIRVIQRRGQDAGVLYVGPRGLNDWHAAHTDGWREESGQIFTDQPGALLHGDFKLPARAAIELEISWQQRADFVVALGVGLDDASVSQAFRLEGSGNSLIILRELATKADVALVKSIPSADGKIHLHVLLDQEAGRCRVLSDQGEQLAELNQPPAERRVLPGLRLINKRGDLRLHRLRISPWRAAAPLDVAPGKALVDLVEGSMIYGRIVQFDAAAQELLGAQRNPGNAPCRRAHR